MRREKKKKMLQVRMSEEEFRLLKILSEGKKGGMSATIRLLLQKAVTDRLLKNKSLSIRFTAEDLAELKKLTQILGREPEDFIGDENSLSLYSDTEKKEISGYIQKVLGTLTPKEEKVIRMRFGIGVDRDHTLEEVGRDLFITRERVRQIEAKALRKLKHPSRLRSLKTLVSTYHR